MGIKSTTTLSRESAESLYADLKGKLKARKWRAQAVGMSDYDLGNALDVLADQVAASDGNTCFDNYLVDDRSHDY